jgi:hypothetical protein
MRATDPPGRPPEVSSPAPSVVITASLLCHPVSPVSSGVIQCLLCHPVSSGVIQCHPVSSSVIQCHHRAWHGDPRLAVLRREIREYSRLRATFARAGPGQVKSVVATSRNVRSRRRRQFFKLLQEHTPRVHAQVYPSPPAATHGTLRGTAGRGRHSAQVVSHETTERDQADEKVARRSPNGSQ